MATYGTIILGVVQLVMTVICMFIIEKVGRKPLLIVGFGGMCIFSLAIAIVQQFKVRNKIKISYFDFLLGSNRIIL
jgi:MFS family permease